MLSDDESAMSLLAPFAMLLLLLAAATASLLVLKLGWRKRAVRVQARHWARLVWTETDAAFVVLAALVLLSGQLFAGWSGQANTPSATPPLALLLLSLAVQPTFTFLLCAYRGAIARRGPLDLLGVRRSTWRRNVRSGILGGLALVLPALLLSELSRLLLLQWNVLPEPQDAMRWIGSADTPAAIRLAVVLHSVLLAPVLEEVLYRGVLLSVVLRARRAGAAVLLVSTLFAALHLQAQVLVPLVFVGAAFAWGLLATGSLLTPIVMHMVFNAGNILLILASG